MAWVISGERSWALLVKGGRRRRGDNGGMGAAGGPRPKAGRRSTGGWRRGVTGSGGRRVWMGLERLQDVPAYRLAPEHHVKDHHVGADLPDKLEGTLPLPAALDRVALVLQDGRHQFQQALIVVQDDNERPRPEMIHRLSPDER